jgi:RNA polymerase sigma-70 factor, ECF subfamily
MSTQAGFRYNRETSRKNPLVRLLSMGEERNIQRTPVAGLMDLARKGDRRAFGELYQLYLTPVFRYLFSQTKNRELAEDLSQTVFIKALQHLENSPRESSRGSEIAYFFAIAKTTLIDFWRKKKETVILDEHSETMRTLVDERAGALENLTEKEHQLLVEKGLAILNEKEREVLVLRFLNDYSHREIAALLGKNEAAIRQLQCRGLKTLRKYFSSYHSSKTL